VEPFLIAPKYFDQEALSMLSGKLVTGQPGIGSGDASELKRKSWDAFSILLKFGFMLLLRATNCSLIVLHVSQKIAEIIDAYALLDLAELEGHKVAESIICLIHSDSIILNVTKSKILELV